MIKFDITNRWTKDIQFTADIDCEESEPISIKLGLAVIQAIKQGTDLRGADLRGADLRYTNFKGANLWDANLRDTNLRYTNFKGANLWDANLRDTNLRDADLRGADFKGTDFKGANLMGANLRDADLRYTNLRDTNLRDADLRDADLRYTNLRDTNLRDADLRDADLMGVMSNSKRIKTMSLEKYEIVYTYDTLQIGCERHSISDWMSFDDKKIISMDGREALKWCIKFKPLIKMTIELNPAEPMKGS